MRINIEDQQYTADANDTSLDVAAYFGFDSVSFTVETEIGATPNAYAIKGFLYNENNVADVTITEGPKLARSSQLIFEANFNVILNPGRTSSELSMNGQKHRR
ncbi:hypothetical protein LXM25_00035 [Dyadobacter sp. LJ53]|uniref:hypothetical protein n=1 Tax=Dyadobacter chenwenxiniae TaxID=2906456 RepID=UPI001F369057|nr:hypothetical protein [Dyadobacter chenwenxiniae]MCF0048421.1 hypothetical protein [Dyadobacter chenwenxiniae]